MTGETNDQRADPALVATIVARYVTHHSVSPDQIGELIGIVRRALLQLGRPEAPPEVLIPAVPVRRSVQRDFVTCLDCGWKGKMLRRHLQTHHGLSSEDYLKRWNLASDHPLTAPAYSAQRSTLAKELGLGRSNRSDDEPGSNKSGEAGGAASRRRSRAGA